LYVLYPPDLLRYQSKEFTAKDEFGDDRLRLAANPV
jgi:hypothetical protein